MGFRIVLSVEAKNDLDQLDLKIAKRIIKKLIWLNEQPDPQKLARILRQPATGDLRFRVGDYRLIAILKIKEKMIIIVQIGHRSKVYL